MPSSKGDKCRRKYETPERNLRATFKPKNVPSDSHAIQKHALLLAFNTDTEKFKICVEKSSK